MCAIDLIVEKDYSFIVNAVEFTTELTESGLLRIPAAVAEKLPKTGKARIIVLTDGETEDAEWRQGAYAQFLREDPLEDSIYDSLR